MLKKIFNLFIVTNPFLKFIVIFLNRFKKMTMKIFWRNAMDSSAAMDRLSLGNFFLHLAMHSFRQQIQKLHTLLPLLTLTLTLTLTLRTNTETSHLVSAATTLDIDNVTCSWGCTSKYISRRCLLDSVRWATNAISWPHFVKEIITTTTLELRLIWVYVCKGRSEGCCCK